MAGDTRKLFGDCLLVAPGDSRGAEALRDEIVAPAWERAGGLTAPQLFSFEVGNASLERLAEARAVFVDLTINDPLALYLLGVRDALARRVTIPLYRDALPAALALLGKRAIAVSDRGVAIAAIVARLNALPTKDDAFDSPVAASIKDLKVITRRPRGIGGTPSIALWSIATDGLEKLPTRIGIVCGDIRQVEGIDVWVNSENTLMEMGRMSDVGISAIIRHMGAQFSGDGGFVNDIIQRDLMRAVGGRRRPVPEGTVFWTTAGELGRKGVKRIAHVAAVAAREPAGRGFAPVTDLGKCVTNVLDSMEEESRRLRTFGLLQRHPGLKSILFPLMGTGTAGEDPRIVSCALLSTAVDYLRAKRLRDLERVLFLAYTDFDRDLCIAALSSIAGVEAEN